VDGRLEVFEKLRHKDQRLARKIPWIVKVILVNFNVRMQRSKKSIGNSIGRGSTRDQKCLYSELAEAIEKVMNSSFRAAKSG